MKKILFAIIISIGLIMATPTLAQNETQTLYKIELIVFQQLNPQALRSETWPSHPPLPATNSAVVLKPYQDQDTTDTYELLPKNQWQLDNIAAALRKNTSYELLLHQAWRQPITTPTNTQAIHIFAKPGGNYQILDTIQTQGFSLDKTLVKSIPFDTWKLNGTIALSKQNYFHISTDLILNVSPDGSDKRHLASFRSADKPLSLHMKQDRRLSRDELYYLDHPVLGVLVMITEDDKQNNTPTVRQNGRLLQ